jgi:replicative DNA helicase
MLHGIKNTPAVSASYVRFVITHSNMGKVAAILEDNKMLKQKIDDLENIVMSIKKTADGAKKVADQAMSKAGSNAPVKPKAKKKKTEATDEEANED